MPQSKSPALLKLPPAALCGYVCVVSEDGVKGRGAVPARGGKQPTRAPKAVGQLLACRPRCHACLGGGESSPFARPERVPILWILKIILGDAGLWQAALGAPPTCSANIVKLLLNEHIGLQGPGTVSALRPGSCDRGKGRCQGSRGGQF